MATISLSTLRPSSTVRSSINPQPNNNNNLKQASPNWWTPLFKISSQPDYIDNNVTPMSSSSEAVQTVSSNNKFNPGCFTEEKAKQLRMKTLETTTFHDIMYHSAIASRLASDVSKPMK